MFEHVELGLALVVGVNALGRVVRELTAHQIRAVLLATGFDDVVPPRLIHLRVSRLLCDADPTVDVDIDVAFYPARRLGCARGRHGVTPLKERCQDFWRHIIIQ